MPSEIMQDNTEMHRKTSAIVTSTVNKMTTNKRKPTDRPPVIGDTCYNITRAVVRWYIAGAGYGG